MANRRSSAEHGMRARYTLGCRCKDCTAANRWYAQQWRYNWRKKGARFVHGGVLVRPEASGDE